MKFWVYFYCQVDKWNKFKNIKNVQHYIFSLKPFFIHNNNYNVGYR